MAVRKKGFIFVKSIRTNNFKINKMKNLISKVSKLDNVDKFGISFGVFVFLPLVLMLVVDIATNGAQML